jgi:CheY-like chemotaxis protein
VVEDNEVEREGMTAILKREGYQVFTATDGAHALSVLRFGPTIDVILTDMLLPMVDGWELLRECKRFPELAAIPVVIVTGLGIAGPEWARSLGAVACYRKPVIVADLLEGLRRICGAAADDPDETPQLPRP